MTIEEVSNITGLSKYTLRYYEKVGLIANVKKSKSNYRMYSESDMKRIEFIINMRNAGIGMKKLKQYIELASEGNDTVEQRRNILIEQKKAIDDQIQTLENSFKYIDYKIENYDSIIKNKNI